MLPIPQITDIFSQLGAFSLELLASSEDNVALMTNTAQEKTWLVTFIEMTGIDLTRIATYLVNVPLKIRPR